MAIYSYRARDAFGQPVVGTVEAENEAAVVRLLRDKGLFIVEVRPGRERFAINSGRLLRRVGKQDLAVFCRQLATMLGAGLPIVPALQILAMQAENKILRRNIEEIVRSLEGGETFHEALARLQVFPPIMVHAIEAAELGGSLDEALEELAAHLEREHELQEKVKSALTYPALVVSVALAVLIVLLVFVLPAFQNMLNALGVPLPLPTRIVMGVSRALRRGWPILIFAAGILAYVAYGVLKTDNARYRLDGILLKLPVFGPLHKKAVLSRFSRSLGTLLRSGVPILQAMDVVRRTVGNRVVAEAIARAQESVRDGKGIADPLKESGIFPPMIIGMIAVGEETGALDFLLAKISELCDREVKEAVSRLSALIEPLLIAMLGGAVGFIVISILLPYFQILGNIGNIG
ncbi:type II secretion system F family protein [Thermosediminibacter oceani]|uniref:Type II secretion system F domain protein n=1 Tax=Thermosediminibacter oceani (strain ATCC BAA-1034 / DSM 16646 / JW/IW-1228P) TaxID=555079 RepID=D9RZA3_THEOJ|nr:type II secretion system F family protein [Thermosediminibacter oceani]ADL08657.1 Type II secretion system F domain protein [Thermosediminibacter oceani DSM 16646]